MFWLTRQIIFLTNLLQPCKSISRLVSGYNQISSGVLWFLCSTAMLIQLSHRCRHWCGHDKAWKGQSQAKITKKSVILLWLLNMTIWCKHVHRLELQKFLIFSPAHSPVRLDIETKFPYFFFRYGCPKLEIRNFVSISRLTGEYAAEN